MGALIDSSGLIAAEKSLGSISRALFANEPVAIAAPTASELLEVVERTEDSALASQRAAFVERLLEHVEVIPFDGPAARIRARLEAEGNGGPNVGAAADSRALDVAAIALSRGWFVLTSNGRYDAINGLKIVRI